MFTSGSSIWPIEPTPVRVELPVSLAEIIAGLSEDIEQLSGQAGLLIMQAVMQGEVEGLAGPKGKHDPEHRATRWATQRGYVVVDDKKVPVNRPRLRDLAGHEVGPESYERFKPTTQHLQEAHQRHQHPQVRPGDRRLHGRLWHQQERPQPRTDPGDSRFTAGVVRTADRRHWTVWRC